MSTSTLPPRTTPDLEAPEAPPTTLDEKPVLTLSATALAAGALAAVTSAVIGSHLGTAGTLTGAALGSIIGALSTALYTFGLQRTWHSLSGLTPRRARLVAGVLLSALVAFLVALGAITGVEKATGTSLTGEPGTTLQQVRVVTVERAAPAGVTDAEPAVGPVQAEPTASEGATPTEVTPTPQPSEAPATTTQPTPTPSAAPAPTTAPTDATPATPPADATPTGN